MQPSPAGRSTALLAAVAGPAEVPPGGPVPAAGTDGGAQPPHRGDRRAVVVLAIAAVLVVLVSGLGTWWALDSGDAGRKTTPAVAGGGPAAEPSPSDEPLPSPSPSSSPSSSPLPLPPPSPSVSVSPGRTAVDSGATRPSDAAVMPDVVGADEQAAGAEIQQAGLTPVIVHESRPDTPAGRVFETLPAAGSSVMRGSQVELRVAVHPPNVRTVPSVLGQSVREAAAQLIHAGYVPRIRPATALKNPDKWVIVQQDPASGTARIGGIVDLTARRHP